MVHITNRDNPGNIVSSINKLIYITLSNKRGTLWIFN